MMRSIRERQWLTILIWSFTLAVAMGLGTCPLARRYPEVSPIQFGVAVICMGAGFAAAGYHVFRLYSHQCTQCGRPLFHRFYFYNAWSSRCVSSGCRIDRSPLGSKPSATRAFVLMLRLLREPLMPRALRRAMARSGQLLAWAACIMFVAFVWLLFASNDSEFLAPGLFASMTLALLPPMALLLVRNRLREFVAQLEADDFGCCLECGYSLRGLGHVGGCPECGKLYELTHLKPAWRAALSI